MKKSICVVTSTRADYGILFPLLKRLATDPQLELRLAVTGTHLSRQYGNTVSEIERDGMPIDCRIPILEDATSEQTSCQVMANAINGFSKYLSHRRPDMVLLLGDRYEIFAIAAAVVSHRIPIAHIHGGETTEGALDECFRHSITKMSYLHFTSCEAYRKRVIQLGEAPERVFNFGAMGVENTLHAELISIDELERELDFPFKKASYAMVTFHPVTLEEDSSEKQLNELLNALSRFPKINFLMTMSNADAGGQSINEILKQYGDRHDHCAVFESLGMVKYLSALKHASFVIGNSSSALIEAPSFGIPSINIGDRQRGRIQAESVINCPPNREAIGKAIELAVSPAFQSKAKQAINPYGTGDTSAKIYAVIRKFLVEGAPIDLKKSFYDVNFQY